MFTGNYSFFEYKYNIPGYTGQDYGGLAQQVYLIISIVLLIILLVALRKASAKRIISIVRFIGIFMLLFYICKTTWESIYDIKLSGSFNTGLLPLDTCSLIIPACLIVGYGKGKVKKLAECWLTTGCLLGGVASMLFLNAFRYYPFLSFGALYSMIWHFLMVFVGLLLITTNYVELKYKTVLDGFLFHLIVSIIIIPIDFIFNFDFMLYKGLGGVPIFEGIASNFSNMNMVFLNPIMMILLYFIGFNIVFFISLGIKKAINLFTKKVLKG